MALAGPMANLALAALALAGIRIGLATGHFTSPERPWVSAMTVAVDDGAIAGLATLLSILFSLNLILFLFNLLPFPPLDGSAVVQLFLSESAGRRYQELLSQPMLSLMGIVIAWRIFSYLFQPLILLALRLLYPDVVYR
jgi:Zn-dependent protease